MLNDFLDNWVKFEISASTEEEALEIAKSIDMKEIEKFDYAYR